MNEAPYWVALIIGNSRLHWALFTGNQLQHVWNTPHLSEVEAQQLITSRFQFSTFPGVDPFPFSPLPFEPELWIASVVPAQTQIWNNYPNARLVGLEMIPLQGIYPTLGIDRALALWGAIQTSGSPVLVIDAGTALTFTGTDENHQLIGGAILPGLQLQYQSLGQKTAALPQLSTSHSLHFPPLPCRWALDTNSAIASGVIHTLMAGIQSFVEDWWYQFPASAVVLTGGDSEFLYRCLEERSPNLAAKTTLNPHVIFEGIQTIAIQAGL